MSYQDPQSVTIDGVNTSLPRTGFGAASGTFRSPDQKIRLLITHRDGKRNQHVARIEFNDIVANPLVPSQFSAVNAAVTFTVNAPLNGISAKSQKDLASALVAWLTADNLQKLIGGEN